jgi:hypothetical protein
MILKENNISLHNLKYNRHLVNIIYIYFAVQLRPIIFVLVVAPGFTILHLKYKIGIFKTNY